MAKILRKNMKIFGSSPGVNEIAKFGSLAAGSPIFTTDVETIQSLSNYLQGWFAAVIGGNSPAIEDMNALCYVYAYQLAYLFQEGVAEWNSLTSYFIGSMVNDGLGTVFISLIDNNLNNALTNANITSGKWKVQNRGVRLVTGTDTATSSDNLIRAKPTAASFVETLPAVAGCYIGQQIIVKNVETNGNQVTVKGSGVEPIDGVASGTIVLESSPTQESATFSCNGTGWDII